MTEEQEMLLDCWIQFSSYTEKGVQKNSNMGLSTLEMLEDYLKKNNLINDDGSPKEA